MAQERTEPVLRVRDLRIRYLTRAGELTAVDGLSFDVYGGHILGLVGESGAGKSLTALAILGLLRDRRVQVTGEIIVDGVDLLTAGEETVRDYRGSRMAMVFQDSHTALDPYQRVGRQISEAYLAHHSGEKKVARQRAVELLDRVGVPEPATRAADYPHQFSGGMRQRVMIAMALINNPLLLIADEPTSGLDVTVQWQIVELMTDIQREYGSAVVFITHDVGLVGQIADEVLVMYAGRAVEHGSVRQVLTAPQHPYTWGLMDSVPTLRGDPAAPLTTISGTAPNALALPSGCSFHPRCRYAMLGPDGPCARLSPELLPSSEAEWPPHLVACHLPAEDRARLHPPADTVAE